VDTSDAVPMELDRRIGAMGVGGGDSTDLMMKDSRETGSHPVHSLNNWAEGKYRQLKPIQDIDRSPGVYEPTRRSRSPVATGLRVRPLHGIIFRGMLRNLSRAAARIHHESESSSGGSPPGPNSPHATPNETE